MSVYLDGATVQECRDLLQRGVRIEELAGRLRMNPRVLERLVVLHSPIVRVRADPSMIEIDLWHDYSGVL